MTEFFTLISSSGMGVQDTYKGVRDILTFWEKTNESIMTTRSSDIPSNLAERNEHAASQKLSEQKTSKYDEKILVVRRDLLFGRGKIDQLKPGLYQDNLDNIQEVIRSQAEYKKRGLMEQDENYKQIIPYLVFAHKKRLFLMRRSQKASETRLANLYSLGIGGHVREEDIVGKNIEQWGVREFHEEVNYTGDVGVKLLGVLNDDSDSVGRVHLGLVFLLTGSHARISIKSELAEGKLVTQEVCQDKLVQMESWSKIAYSFLKRQRFFIQ